VTNASPPHAAPPSDRHDRARGALLGLAVGDAVGTTLEFRPPGSFEPISDMVGGGPFRLDAGQFTDDTSMALCLAESLIETDRFEPVDQLQRYVRWWREGHLSATGRCFDIGNTVVAALQRFEATGDPHCGSTDPHSAGNGSIMRLAPMAIAFADHPVGVHLCGESSRTTHQATAAIDACRYLGALLIGALHGRSRAQLLQPRFEPEPGTWSRAPLCPEIDAIAAGSFLTRQPPEIRGTGYVVESLEAALWAFHRADSFKEAVLLAANLGDDADTTAAITGQIAGAHWGETAIPPHWRHRLAFRSTIETFADSLIELAPE
jgi:ADP-ribosyl-[dinitrogen reductase] hydrolase